MRQLKRSDIPELTRILHNVGAFSPTEIDCAVELLSIALDDPHGDYEVKVAEAGGHPAGYVLFGPVPLTLGVYDIYWIATDPQLHGQGYGRQLLKAVEAELASRKARLICLETSSQESYGRTCRFYERAGYREESRLKDFYRPGDDRITYVKRLRS